MCLAVPMEVVKIADNSAVVEYEGTRREVRLDLVNPKPDTDPDDLGKPQVDSVRAALDALLRAKG